VGVTVPMPVSEAGAVGSKICRELLGRLDAAARLSVFRIGHCLVVMVVMTIGIAKGPARVMARRAFVVMGAGEGAGGGDDGDRRGDGGGRQAGAPRKHSDGCKFPFSLKRARWTGFVRTCVERSKRANAFQPYDKGSIPLTRCNLFKHLRSDLGNVHGITRSALLLRGRPNWRFVAACVPLQLDARPARGCSA
jgi:hypothetical protein